jgi:ATP/maltotriose-dependent transcriptional regulator MalT
MGMGNAAWESGDELAALRAYEECLAIWTAMDDRLGIASALTNIGLVRMYGGDAAGAAQHLEQSVRIYREEEDQESTAVALNCLGQAYGRAGEYARAEQLVREGLALNLEIGDKWNITYDLVALAQIACAQRDYARGVRLLAAAEAHYDDVFERLERLDRVAYEQCMEEARNALGEGMFNIAWADGLALSPQLILHGDLVGAPSAPEQIHKQAAEAPRIDPGLSTREMEVLALLTEGLSNAEIAEKLYLSLYTVQAHLRNIYGKLSVTSRTAAIRYAVENGLV